MQENTSVFNGIPYVSMFILFITGFNISRSLNAPRIFHLISAMSAIGILLASVMVKWGTPLLNLNTLLAFTCAEYTVLVAFRFLELGFGLRWKDTRDLSFKMLFLFIIAFPRMHESTPKSSKLPVRTVREESVLSILRGICQFIILQVLLRAIPAEWLTVPVSPPSVIVHYLRYGLLCVILYLAMDSCTGVGLGIYTYLSNVPMYPIFSAFPFSPTCLRDFWSRRWNNLIRHSLHVFCFTIIPKLMNPIMSLSKTTKGLLAFVMSGLLHEYGVWFICSKWSGKYMIFFLIHGILVSLEIALKVPMKPQSFQGRLLGWLWSTAILLITSPLFFDPMVEAGIFAGLK